MSITSRINEMSSHIEQAYDELQGLGADLTNVNKNIENISMVLDDIYDSMPQVSGEGTSLTLDDTRVGKIKSTLKGNTSQTGTPTPSYPQPINVVSGDNEINVVGKNLVNYDNNTNLENKVLNASGVFESSSYTYANGTIRPNGNQITISFNNRVGDAYVRIGEYKIDGTFIKRTLVTTTPTTLTLDSNTSYLIYSIDKRSDTYFEKLQLEVGSSASTYEPYQGNTYNIDLPEGMELCKIGNYQDYFYKDSGKWYLHKEIGKIVLDGTEDWNLQSVNAYGIANLQLPVADYIGGSDNLGALCDHFTKQASLISQTQTEGFFLNIAKTLFIRINSTTANTKDIFKTWLSTNNTILYYALATPTTTELTYQPLVDQLNLLEKAMSKDGQTNISQVNNDLPFIISASALKEWQESTSLNSTLSMVNPLSLGNTLNTQENDIQPIEVDNIEPLEEEENEES